MNRPGYVQRSSRCQPHAKCTSYHVQSNIYAKDLYVCASCQDLKNASHENITLQDSAFRVFAIRVFATAGASIVIVPGATLPAQCCLQGTTQHLSGALQTMSMNRYYWKRGIMHSSRCEGGTLCINIC